MAEAFIVGAVRSPVGRRAGGLSKSTPLTWAAADLGLPDPFSGSDGWTARYGDAPVSQFVGAELIADKWGLTREAMEDFAVMSHERVLAAQVAGGYFDRESPRLPGSPLTRSAPSGPAEDGVGQANVTIIERL